MTEPHRDFAVEAFNRSWELLESPRSPDQDTEALAAAFASRWHWGRIGGEEQLAVGDHQVAKVASELGFGDLALHFARLAWDRGERKGWTDWRRAVFAEGMARAYNAIGDQARRDEWLRTAADVLATVEDAEDRHVVESQLRELPGWSVVNAR